MHFRRATIGDAATVRDITRAAYAKWVPVIGREPKPMTADYERAVLEHMIDVVEADGQPIGLIEVIPEPAYLLIENVAVLPDRHGQGIGGLLMERAEEMARSMGLLELRLYTNAAFVSNIDFYARRGFVEFLREPFPGRGVAVHMKKAVAQA